MKGFDAPRLRNCRATDSRQIRGKAMRNYGNGPTANEEMAGPFAMPLFATIGRGWAAS